MSLTSCVNLKEKLSKCRSVAVMEKSKLKQIQQEFEDIMYHIEDLKHITMIFQDFMWDNCTASMGKMQSIVNVQLRLLEQLEQECLELDERF